jgi:F-type H+-transporting ATPase subunit a
MEFYPDAIFFAGTPFELNRIMLIRLLVMTALVVLFWLWTSKFKKAYKENILVPSRFS